MATGGLFSGRVGAALRQVPVGHHMERKGCMVNVCARPGRKEEEAHVFQSRGDLNQGDSG